MSETDRTVCVACKETIHPGATTCPHCHSRQKRSATQIFTESLKWAGGIAALITLLLSASELNKLVDAWLKNERVVDEYVAAARLLGKTGDHSNAQSLLQQAGKLDPASSELRDLQIELAKKKLRTFLLLDRDGVYLAELKTVINKSDQEVLDFRFGNNSEQELQKLQLEELVSLFARGIVSSQSQEKSTLLAHLGWIELLRRFGPVESDVEARFRDALQVAPDNPYANAMYAAWLLSPRNRLKRSNQERIELARQHFESALRANQEIPWIAALWLETLTLAPGVEADHELLRVIQRVKDAGWPLYEHGPAGAAINMNFIYTVARGHPADEENEQKIQLLFAAFKPADLLAKINWLTELRYGCRPGPACEPQVQDARLLYMTGRIHTELGQDKEALEMFRLAATPEYRSSLAADVIIQQLEKTLQKLAIGSKRVMLLNTSTQPWQRQDLVVEYAGQTYPTANDLTRINTDLQDGQKVAIRVLRAGDYLDISAEPLSPYMVNSYVVPENLLAQGKETELQRWWSHSAE